MAILKSRFGKSGVIFDDVIFDNSTIQISMDKENKGVSFLGHKDTKEQLDQEKVNRLMSLAASNSRQNVLND
jgi:hypothetical protein